MNRPTEEEYTNQTTSCIDWVQYTIKAVEELNTTTVYITPNSDGRYYIGTDEVAKNTLFTALDTDNNLLITSECGTGKSTILLDYYRNNRDKLFIFSVPNRIMYQQQLYRDAQMVADPSNDYNVSIFDPVRGNGLIICPESLNNGNNVSPTSTLGEKFKEATIIVDEVHTLYKDGYRHYDGLLDIIRNGNNRMVYCTATPYNIPVTADMHHIKFSSPTNVNATIYPVLRHNRHTTSKVSFVDQHIVPRHPIETPLLYINSDRSKDEHRRQIVDCDWYQMDSVNRLKCPTWKNIIEESDIEGKTLSTAMLSAGVNIVNEGEVILVVNLTGVECSVGNLQQIISRFRNSSHVHVYVLQTDLRSTYIGDIFAKTMAELSRNPVLSDDDYNSIIKKDIKQMYIQDGDNWIMDDIRFRQTLDARLSMAMSPHIIANVMCLYINDRYEDESDYRIKMASDVIVVTRSRNEAGSSVSVRV